MKSTDTISWLEGFSRKNRDRTSNSKFEIYVTTLENGGWSVSIDFAGTALSGACVHPGPDPVPLDGFEEATCHGKIRTPPWPV